MSGDGLAPIIIKRKKVVGGDGHHGGAWKVAYADFVTAMMAFFLLMWLLNATTEKQRKGIADYFNPTIPINRISGGGDGAFGGDSVFTEETLAQNGVGAAMQQASVNMAAADPEAERAAAEEAAGFSAIQDGLMGFSGESMASDQLLRHIVTRVTDEGLIIELYDLEDEPLFEPGTAKPTEITRELIQMVVGLLTMVKNDLAVNGYMASHAVVLKDNPVWRISTQRAEQIRVLMSETGLDPERVQRIAGHADRKPVVRNLLSSRNNRVELILLREQF
ncbi:OmpA/MotB family protein [Candidatus Halocynthiibacter alkanivorans]|jgi:chemotaxis protein MotB|uniref:OmpA/MotB family protein n=1 Tax=Candidatus Halocynthiibacter alkanivorans TaxID=2267619 RepID=UPI000DF16BFE|nr:flagellar motor protein MotB [Candidatus Halocynthiibacter alkanivorans]